MTDQNIEYDDNFILKDGKPKSAKKPVKKETKKEVKKETTKAPKKEVKKESKPSEKKSTKLEGSKKESKPTSKKNEGNKKTESKSTESKKKSPVKKKKEEKDNTPVYISILLVILIFAILMKTNKISFPTTEEIISENNIDVIAVVNGVSIYQSQIDEKFNSIPAELKEFYTKEKILEQEINNLLLLQRAEAVGTQVTEEEITNILNILMERYGGEERFLMTLENFGLTLEEYKKDLEKETKVIKFLNESVYTNIKVTEDEALEYYTFYQDKFTIAEEINASHILICFDGKSQCAVNRTRGEAFGLFKQVVSELDAGLDFALAAKKYSDGPSAERGGELGVFPKGVMVESFETMAFSLKEGAYNQAAAETIYGYHIIKVHNIYPEVLMTFEEVEDQVYTEIRQGKEKKMYESFLENQHLIGDIQIIGESVDCPAATELEEGTILFLTSDKEWCAHCKTMENVVQQLEKNGAKFDRIDFEDTSDNIFNSCFQKNKEQGAPQFVCPTTGETIVGTTSNLKLIQLANNCK